MRFLFISFNNVLELAFNFVTVYQFQRLNNMFSFTELLVFFRQQKLAEMVCQETVDNTPRRIHRFIPLPIQDV